MIEELKSFWINIWIHKKSYYKKARWTENIKEFMKIMNRTKILQQQRL